MIKKMFLNESELSYTQFDKLNEFISQNIPHNIVEMAGDGSKSFRYL